jgi:hypothetical protein
VIVVGHDNVPRARDYMTESTGTEILSAPSMLGTVDLALDVKAIHAPPCMHTSLVILHTKYTLWCDNDFSVHA